MQIVLKNIEWDIDDMGEHESLEDFGLATEMVFDPDSLGIDLSEVEDTDYLSVEKVDEIIDVVSDEMGYCIFNADVYIED